MTGDKACLTLCCLVCRHWAEVCRPAVFRELKLRGGADVDSMLQLLMSSGSASPSLADSLCCINAVHRGPWGIPWVHRLSFIQPYAPDRLRFALHLEKLEGQNTVRLWGAPLPRTLPGSIFHVSRLEIADAQFRRVADLLGVVRDLPKLMDLRCRSVSFSDRSLATETAVRRRRRSLPDGHNLVVHTLQCSEPLQMEESLIFFLLSQMYYRQYRFLGQEIVNDLRVLLTSLKLPPLKSS